MSILNWGFVPFEPLSKLRIGLKLSRYSKISNNGKIFKIYLILTDIYLELRLHDLKWLFTFYSFLDTKINKINCQLILVHHFFSDITTHPACIVSSEQILSNFEVNYYKN